VQHLQIAFPAKRADGRTFVAQTGLPAAATDAPRKETIMLVLSRKLGEKIFIGDNICITVVDIDRGKIRLGIEAPREVAIYRQELLPAGSVPGALPTKPVASSSN
jgi:carbon storage regulator